jgi:hypothetical protein
MLKCIPWKCSILLIPINILLLPYVLEYKIHVCSWKRKMTSKVIPVLNEASYHEDMGSGGIALRINLALDGDE